MTDLRSELGVAPPPARYRILCPPGWRRVGPEALLGDEATAGFRAEAARAGRGELVRELDELLEAGRAAMRSHRITEVYVGPADEQGLRAPATLSVAPLALPTGVTLDAALARIGGGAAAPELDGARERMHVLEREAPHGEQRELTAHSLIAVAPVPSSSDRRALVLTFTALSADDASRGTAADLLDVGRIMLMTFRWSAA